ncbi:hypothetical protein AYI69_g896 [Smittium culicis]|uniref:Uncharacterized protein n=1 Tax=Smittium culicis TaxID=133412 RepID=A0A1R1YRS3_9FUNG|nr:hypothetical protein AYI69_g896 [Smittium culicis]
MEKLDIPRPNKRLNPLNFENFDTLYHLDKIFAIIFIFRYLKITSDFINKINSLDRISHLNRFHRTNIAEEINSDLKKSSLDYLVLIEKLESDIVKKSLVYHIDPRYIEKEYRIKYGRRAPVPFTGAPKVPRQVRRPEELSVKNKATVLGQANNIRKRRKKNPNLCILSKRRGS